MSKLPPKNILLISCMKMEKQIALSYSTANHFFAHETRPLVIQLLFSTTPISGRPPSHAIQLILTQEIKTFSVGSRIRDVEVGG